MHGHDDPRFGGPLFHRGGLFGPGAYHHGGGHPLEWAILGVTIAILVVVTALLVLRLAGRSRPGWRKFAFPGGPPDPAGLLRLRYARGELSRDEFLQASSDLGEPPTEAAAEPPPA